MLIYSGAKAALISSMKCMACELSRQGIRLNCVSPSDIDTHMQKVSDENRTLIVEYPFGRGKIDDVANMIIFLLSDKAKWLSRQNYTIDCGII